MILSLQGTEHAEYRHGIGYPFEFMQSQVIQGKRTPHQPCGHVTDHDGVGCC